MIEFKKFKKKNFLIILGLLIFVFILTGCSQNEAESSNESNNSANETNVSESGTQPAKGGEFIYALATAPDSLDPQQSGFAVSIRVLKGIFENLVYIGEDNTPQPWLATEWELSEDNKTYTFKLREGITFHDGEPFNAEAVKYSFERLGNPEKGFANSRYVKNVTAIEVVDEYTIKITIESPSATFLTNLAQTALAIVSPKAAEEAGNQFGLNPIGTGPFKFEEQSENNQIVLSKYEDYNGEYPFSEHEGPAYLDKLVFKIVPEEATRTGSVQSGQITAAETVPPQDIVAIKNNNNLKLWEAESAGQSYGIFINNTTAPWDDVKARQALRQSIDVDSIVKTLYLGTYERAWSVISPNVLGYDDSLENKDPYDVDQANKAFDELGWEKGSDGFREKEGKKLTLRILDDAVNREKRQDISLMIKEQLKEVGIDVQIETSTETSAIISEKIGYDVFGNSRVALDPDDLAYTFHSQSIFGQGGLNFAWYKNEEVDRLLEQGATLLDPAKREEVYKKVQNIVVVEDAVKIPIYVFPYTVATSADVEGLKFDTVGYPLFYDVNLTK